MARPLRIGVLIPSTNQVVEPDFAAMVPKGVTYHSERLWNDVKTPPGGGDGTYLRSMNDDIERAVRYLASANLDIIAYGCTSGTYHAGTVEYDHKVTKQIHGLCGLPAVTAVAASVEAMKHVKARKLSVIGPYGNYLLQNKLKPLLESQGFEVIQAQGETAMQQRTHDSIIGDQEPAYIASYVAKLADTKADTIFLPGTAWRTLEIVDELERKLNKTVVTVNQATIWATFKKLGVLKPVKGYGRLFAQP
ncbi:MAG: hypothetical protein FJ320_09290 [SAR202 cluster bacterium]|nr:hypothetical protein [SAR202 cluster bacterium]